MLDLGVTQTQIRKAGLEAEARAKLMLSEGYKAPTQNTFGVLRIARNKGVHH